MHAARFFVDRHAAFSNQLHGLRIQHVFNLMDFRLEHIERVAFRDLNRTLRDNRAFVVIFVGEMHGHARHLHARFEGIANGMRAFKRRQQRGVQIQHAIRERAQHDRSHLAHVTSHNDVFGASSLQRFDNLGIGGFRIGVQRFVHNEHRNARSLRTFDAVRVGARRNHLNNFRIQRARSDVVNERLQIRARARKQNADFQRLSHVRILSRCK